MGVNFENTSDANGFNIFEKLTTDEFSVGGQKNKLNLYILKIHDKLFSYDKLYDYVLDNICQYVFNRRKNLEVQNDIKKAKRLILEAIDHLREVNSDKDSGAGGELGEILLYLFLEQDLKAPKLFSKIELKTSTNEYIKGADGIHLKFRKDKNGKKILQLVIGEAKIKNELDNAIGEAFISINTYITNNAQDLRLLDTHIMNQLVEDEEALILKQYLLGDGEEEKETIFGIFIGYNIDYDGSNDSNDLYKENVKQANLKQVLGYKEKIINEIKKYNIRNYQFNFYFLPFHNAQRDRKIIIKQLTEKESVFTWRDIRNG